METLDRPETTMKCNHIANIENVFHENHFEILDLLINKKGRIFIKQSIIHYNPLLDGSVKWFIPNQLNPFLTCHDEDIKKVKFISFSGSNKNNAVYYFDCPEKDHINYVDLIDIK